MRILHIISSLDPKFGGTGHALECFQQRCDMRENARTIMRLFEKSNRQMWVVGQRR
jgi:hypothetical protein